MKPGDKVRFLSQTGGGIVVGFDKKGWALVEDEEGFQIPVPRNECVVVEENTVGKTVAGENSASAKVIQTRTGDELHAALVYTQEKGGVIHCTFANECNYNLLVTYTIIYKGAHTTVFAGEILPYQRSVIFTLTKEALQDGAKKVQVRAIPFKRAAANGVVPQGEFNRYKGIEEKKGWNPKPVIEKEFTLDTVNLLKDSSFKENEYLSVRGYVIPVIREGAPGPDEIKELQQELYAKYSKDAGAENRSGKGGASAAVTPDEDALIKVAASGILEVDLHAHELLETTSGMGNAEILLYQLEKFNEVMVAQLHKKGTRIVFIHGKGDGVLRNALLKELKTKYSRCTWQDASFREYGFGATMVTVR